MNLCILIGRPTADPEISYTANSNTKVAKFTLAIDRPKKTEEHSADFLRITCFGKTADITENWVQKGKQIAVRGTIQTGSYTNKEGQKVYTTDIVSDRIELLGSKSDKPTVSSNEQVAMQGFQATDEDIPF